jgi:hypothetical protein
MVLHSIILIFLAVLHVHLAHFFICLHFTWRELNPSRLQTSTLAKSYLNSEPLQVQLVIFSTNCWLVQNYIQRNVCIRFATPKFSFLFFLISSSITGKKTKKKRKQTKKRKKILNLLDLEEKKEAKKRSSEKRSTKK